MQNSIWPFLLTANSIFHMWVYELKYKACWTYLSSFSKYSHQKTFFPHLSSFCCSVFDKRVCKFCIPATDTHSTSNLFNAHFLYLTHLYFFDAMKTFWKRQDAKLPAKNCKKEKNLYWYYDRNYTNCIETQILIGWFIFILNDSNFFIDSLF